MAQSVRECGSKISEFVGMMRVQQLVEPQGWVIQVSGSEDKKAMIFDKIIKNHFSIEQ